MAGKQLIYEGRTMRLALEAGNDLRRVAAVWRESEPFVLNKSGQLVHRPRYVHVYNIHKRPHMAVGYYCGNGATDDAKKGKLSFVAAPPEGATVCEACERRAVMAGLPSSSELAGRHVHTGKLKAVMTCCV